MPATDRDLRAEVVELTRALIRVDTSNPPGNETPAAELLAAYLRDSGVEPELVGPDPGRLNLIARIEGRGEGPSLMLMGHTDVVPAPPENWSVPPFEARLRDDLLLGRGAADMKGEVAARAVAFASLARRGEPPAGDVVLVAEADEERNTSDVGMPWLVRERPDVRCDYALNEGGGLVLDLADGRRVVTIAVGEKRAGSLRIRIFGEAGHASVPAAADNPLRHMATAIGRLLDYEAPARLDPAIERALRVLGAADADEDAIERAGGLHPVLAETLPVTVRTTVTPTGVQSFEPPNVIPPYADVICDCRAVPSEDEADLRAHVERRPRRRLQLRGRAPRAARGRDGVGDRHAAVSGLRGVRRGAPAGRRAAAVDRARVQQLLLGSQGLRVGRLRVRARVRNPLQGVSGRCPRRRRVRRGRRPRRDGGVPPPRDRGAAQPRRPNVIACAMSTRAGTLRVVTIAVASA